MDSNHVLTMRPTQKMDTPTGLVTGSCGCGKWSTTFGTPRNVAASWYEHREAKLRAERAAETAVEPTPLTADNDLDGGVSFPGSLNVRCDVINTNGQRCLYGRDHAVAHEYVSLELPKVVVPDRLYTRQELDTAIAVGLGRVLTIMNRNGGQADCMRSVRQAAFELGLDIEGGPWLSES